MILKWESEEARLARFMKIPPRKKLEWLYEMKKFVSRFSLKKRSKAARRGRI